MKILQIVNTLAVSDGGPARHAWELGTSLLDLKGNEVTIFVVRGNSKKIQQVSDLEQASNQNTNKPRLLTFKLSGLRWLSDVLGEIKQADFVILHGYYLIWIPIAALYLKVLNKNVLLVPHGSLTKWQSGFSKNKKAIWDFLPGKITQKCLSTFAVGSSQEEQDILSKFPGANVAVVGVGTDFSNVPANEKAIHQPVRLLSLSRITPKKQIELSVEAIKLLNLESPNYELTIVGDHQNFYGKELHVQVENAGLSSCVRFLGQVEGLAKAEIFLNSDIFLLPSADENFGISVAEAAAFGVPVIASSAVAAAKKLSPNATIILEDPSPSSIADSVKTLARLDFQILRRGLQAEAENVFSWRSTAEIFCRIGAK
jgi:glycosyltransferase involved in cell wall biosynthesis